MTRYFRFDHLPPYLQTVSKPFAELAAMVTLLCPEGQQRDMALHYLSISKDAAVRAMLKDPSEPKT